MIKEKEVIIKGHPRNYKYYKELGYDIKVRKDIYIKTSDLMSGSSISITTICSNCSKESNNAFKDYYNYTSGLKEPYYCQSCKYIKSEKTSMERYGVKNPMMCEEVKDRLRSSLLDKYGVDWYSKTDEWLEKFKTSSLIRFGVDNPSKNADVINSIRDTNRERFGVDWPMQSVSIRNKSIETIFNKHGVYSYSKTDEFKYKIINTSRIKYNVDNYSQTIECKNLVKNTFDTKYGGHPMKSEVFKKISKLSKQRNTHIKYSKLIEEFYKTISYADELFTLEHNCGEIFSIQRGLLYSRLKLEKTICTKCNPIGVQYSEFENEICLFLDLYNISYIRNSKILNGLEIDILIPEFNLAIEANGIYWHSELFKNTKYHLNKTNLCKERGLDLLHIWEDDWAHKSDIIKSIILNKLNLITNRIYARKCIIKDVNTNDYRKFLDENHIQGYSSSSIRYGLYHNDELVSLMTFGYRKTNNKTEYELIRFCNKINHAVVGSASKLFKRFLRDYNREVISYADISLFSGSIYPKLGFEYVNLSKPNYYWVVDGIRKHRFNYSKKKLVKLGFDSNLTEVEIMHERGYYRIFSTGQEKWIYKI